MIGRCHLIILILLSLSIQNCSQPVTSEFVADPQLSEPQQVSPLAIYSKAPEFRLPGTDGKWYGLDDFKKDVLVVVFLSNYCPNSQVYEDRLIEFYREYEAKGVDLVAISSNSPLSTPDDAMGYSDLDDTYQSMVVRAKNKQFNFPYLYDGDKQETAKAYGPPTIPTAYIFDKNRNLQYRGRIDYSMYWGAANAEDLRMWVDAVLRGGDIIRRERDSQGCKVYWSWDQDDKNNLSKAWQDSPVTLHKITLDSLKTILVNFSDKPRVINFWATWCGPCKQEFPEFLRMRRMYRYRPVEFISVCLDDPDHYDVAMDFLKQMHAPGKNYLVEEEDKEEIRKKVFEGWDGSLPFTIMVEHLGKPYQVWQGPFDPVGVRQAIVEHRLIGRYYIR